MSQYSTIRREDHRAGLMDQGDLRGQEVGVLVVVGAQNGVDGGGEIRIVGEDVVVVVVLDGMDLMGLLQLGMERIGDHRVVLVVIVIVIVIVIEIEIEIEVDGGKKPCSIAYGVAQKLC
jgi:hypothetical protein